MFSAVAVSAKHRYITAIVAEKCIYCALSALLRSRHTRECHIAASVHVLAMKSRKKAGGLHIHVAMHNTNSKTPGMRPLGTNAQARPAVAQPRSQNQMHLIVRGTLGTECGSTLTQVLHVAFVAHEGKSDTCQQTKGGGCTLWHSTSRGTTHSYKCSGGSQMRHVTPTATTRTPTAKKPHAICGVQSELLRLRSCSDSSANASTSLVLQTPLPA